jgi:ribosomal RNA assembly protein
MATGGGKYYVPPLTQDDVPGGACCVAETAFATLFPSYLEKYLQSIWDGVEAVCKQHQLQCSIDLVEGSMSVSTTRHTWDPYAIIKARDFIKLLARNVPLAQAQKIFEDEMTCDIIKIGLKAKNTKRFIKRRDRLIGPEGQTLKAMEILTGCYILVQGKTVSCMGSVRGCQDVRKLVEDCMRNIHPVYGLKRLLIRRELMKREDLKNEDWSRFMPTYKKNGQSKEKQKAFLKKKKERAKAAAEKSAQKGEKSIFPPAPPKRKEDIAMETGEVILGEGKTHRSRKRDRGDFQLQE